jgi:hypothetical protein
VINVGGNRVGTEEIETALLHDRSMPDSVLRNCIVIGVDDAVLGTIPWAFVILSSGTVDAALRERLCAVVSMRIGPHAIPRRITAVSALPETHSGKYMRSLVRTLVLGEEVSLSAVKNPDSIRGISDAIRTTTGGGMEMGTPYPVKKSSLVDSLSLVATENQARAPHANLLEALRFPMAFMVFSGHVWGTRLGGSFAVVNFFALSFRSMNLRPPRPYLVQLCRRLLPAYYVVLAIQTWHRYGSGATLTHSFEVVAEISNWLLGGVMFGWSEGNLTIWYVQTLIWCACFSVVVPVPVPEASLTWKAMAAWFFLVSLCISASAYVVFLMWRGIAPNAMEFAYEAAHEHPLGYIPMMLFSKQLQSATSTGRRSIPFGSSERRSGVLLAWAFSLVIDFVPYNTGLLDSISLWATEYISRLIAVLAIDEVSTLMDEQHPVSMYLSSRPIFHWLESIAPYSFSFYIWQRPSMYLIGYVASSDANFCVLYLINLSVLSCIAYVSLHTLEMWSECRRHPELL